MVECVHQIAEGKEEGAGERWVNVGGSGGGGGAGGGVQTGD